MLPFLSPSFSDSCFQFFSLGNIWRLLVSCLGNEEFLAGAESTEFNLTMTPVNTQRQDTVNSSSAKASWAQDVECWRGDAGLWLAEMGRGGWAGLWLVRRVRGSAADCGCGVLTPKLVAAGAGAAAWPAAAAAASSQHSTHQSFIRRLSSCCPDWCWAGAGYLYRWV